MFNNLRAEMARANISISDIAKVIHKTERSTRDKINGKAGFTWSEIIAIRDAFFPGMSIEYLFAQSEAQSSELVTA